MASYVVSEVSVGQGWLGIGPLPGRTGFYEHDLATILRWGADLVLTMVTAPELDYGDATSFGDDLRAAGVHWWHLPIADMGAPSPEIDQRWAEASITAHAAFARGGRVFTHCYGGCGRAGMISLRLMVEAGDAPDAALSRLRGARPCAVETEAQFAWAAMPAKDRREAKP